MLQTLKSNDSQIAKKSALSSNSRIRCSPIKSKPTSESRTLGQKQIILNKLPSIDVNTLHGSAITELNSILQVSRTVEEMAPKHPSQSMLSWVLEQLRHFFMFNSRLVH